MLPRVGLPVVDVEDVAHMHVRAVTAAGAAGKRIIGADEFMWLTEMTGVLREEYPGRRIPARTAPDFLIRLTGLFDRTIRSIVPLLGRRQELDNTRARELLDMEFTPAADSIRASARYIMERGLVR